MSFLDNLGNAAIGIGTGYLGGGGAGAFTGGLSSLLNRGKPLTAGNAIQGGLAGYGAGQLGGKAATGLSGLFGGASGGAPAVAGQAAGGGWSLPSLSGIGSGIKGALGSLSGLGNLRNIFGNGGGGQQPLPAPQGQGQYGPPQPTGQAPASGSFGGQGALGDLAGLAGLGAGAYALANPAQAPNLADSLAGANAQDQAAISNQAVAEKAARDAATQQYTDQRVAGQKSLEDILGSGTQTAMTDAVRTQQDQLQRQGLLNGPSGALNEAVAGAAGRLRASQLPTLTNYASGTTQGLNDLLTSGLTSGIDLGRSGLGNTIANNSNQRNATLKDKLLKMQQDQARNKALLTLGGQGVGYALGGSEGAKAGANVGGSLEQVLGGGGSYNAI